METFSPAFIFFLVFVFGAIVGSFLNVVILRYHSGATFLGRSMCFSCGKTLAWRDLVPVFSFFAIAGKCRFCRSRISRQYVSVETVTGILFMLLFWKLGGSDEFLVSFSSVAELLVLFTLGSILIVIGGYDIKHKIIPDVFAYAFAGVALVNLTFFSSFAPTAWDFLAGPILAFPFAFLWHVSDGKWMGLGDAKLAIGIGWFLGLSAGFTAIVLAFWIGAVVGLALIGIERLGEPSFFRKHFTGKTVAKTTMKSEIPFAPFLILGTWLVFFIPGIVEVFGFRF